MSEHRWMLLLLPMQRPWATAGENTLHLLPLSMLMVSDAGYDLLLLTVSDRMSETASSQLDNCHTTTKAHCAITVLMPPSN